MRANLFKINVINFLLLILLFGIFAACGGAEEAIVEPAEAEPEPTEGAIDPIQETLAQIDEQLRSTLQGNIALNVPPKMQLDQPAEITLLISPSLSPEELRAEIESNGEVVTDVINITPWMQAELISVDREAFTIRMLHSEPQQPISNVEPTEWKWLLSANEEGPHRLILTISRLVEVEGRESWRLVEEYRHSIDVQVTMGTRLKLALAGLWDLKWWISGLLFPIIVYMILRRLD